MCTSGKPDPPLILSPGQRRALVYIAVLGPVQLIAVAGEMLPEPRVVEETFGLRGDPDNW